MPANMNPDVDRLQAQLRQIEDYRHKGLLRPEQADAQRDAVMQRLMRLVIPDAPVPRIPWRVHVVALVAMAALVGAATAYLLFGYAGLRPKTMAYLAERNRVAAQATIAQQERAARIRAGESLAPDQYGRFPQAASTVATATPSAVAPTSSAPTSSEPAVAPLLAGRIELDPGYASRVAPDDALFVAVRAADDPNGLPLAQLRVQAGNLPLDFAIGAPQLLGSPQRFMQAKAVVVSARISRSGSGLALPGDLVGSSAPVAPWSAHVGLVIAHAVPRS